MNSDGTIKLSGSSITVEGSDKVIIKNVARPVPLLTNETYNKFAPMKQQTL